MQKKNIPVEFVFQLFALIIAVIVVHAFYVSVVRPNAERIIARGHGRVCAAGPGTARGPAAHAPAACAAERATTLRHDTQHSGRIEQHAHDLRIRGRATGIRIVDDPLYLLGVAFNSTFIALLISIFLMFLVHQLQLMQERLVFDSEAYCDDKLIRHMQAD